MYAYHQIVWSSFRYNVYSTDVCVQKGFLVDTSSLHAGNHIFVAEIAECRVVYLDVPFLLTSASIEENAERMQTYDIPDHIAP